MSIFSKLITLFRGASYDAGAAVVEGNAAVALGKLRELEFPGIEQADQAGNEQERRALPALFVVQRDVTGLDPRHRATRRS